MSKHAFVICYCFTALLFSSLAFGQLTTSTANNQIEVRFENKVRLSGGSPYVARIDFDSVSANDERFQFHASEKNMTVTLQKSVSKNTVAIYVQSEGYGKIKKDEFIGFLFSQIPGYKEGVAFYRYKPWNSWTKPVHIANPSSLEAWDNQCFYWQYEDGMYGAAIPLIGSAFRSTLGSEHGRFGSKAVAYVDMNTYEPVPQMVIGFGRNLYGLLQDLYLNAADVTGTKENIASKKKFPEPLEYLGWCTWNASSMGAKLNEQTIIGGVETFTKNNFPLGWVLIDDGWFNHSGSRLRSFKPDSTKFPNGFSPLIKTLKDKYKLKHVGVWHALNGYWNGIDPESALGRRYRSELFSWRQRESVDNESSSSVNYHFIKPNSDSLKSFYRTFHKYLRSQGFSFIKVDNQLVVERMSVDNYPIGVLSKAMHNAMNASAKEFFGNAVINCMDMTGDAYYNFGPTPVARSVEDYFPYETGENYNLQRGNAAAHVMQGIYNNLYFSQFVYPDLDMFQTHNTNGEFHAIARAINNGPIYITDNPGEQNFEILNKLVLSDGKILRSGTPLLPTEDCLFQVQDKKPFKAFSVTNGVGLLGVWNCADADEVTGTFTANDVQGLQGDRFIAFEAISRTYSVVDRNMSIPIRLGRMKYSLYYLAPVTNGVAVLGLINKYNAPAAIEKFSQSTHQVLIRTKDAGTLAVYLPSMPKKIRVGNRLEKQFTYKNNLLTIDLPKSGNAPVNVSISH